MAGTTRAAHAGRTVLAVALVAGLAIRLTILWHTPTLGLEITDEQHYAHLGENLLTRHEFAVVPGKVTSIRPPLYPALLAIVWAISGVGNLQAVRVVQIVLALATALLTGAIGGRAFSPTVGRYAATVVWLYPSLILFNFLILTETLFTLLLVGFLLLAVMLVQRPRVTTAVGCGLALGLAALARSILWPVPALLCPLLLILIPGAWSRRFALSALVFVGYAAAVAPWAIRNTRLQHVVEVVDTMGGINLRMGNYEYTPEDRMWDAVSLQGNRNWVYALAQEHLDHVPTEGEKDKWAQRKAVEYIRANPLTTLRRSLIKFADFWGLEREFIAAVQQGLFSPPRWFAILASIIILIAYAIVALAGVGGLWMAAPDWRTQVVLLLPFTIIVALHTIVFGHSRYHLPLVPILALYGSALFERWRAGDIRMRSFAGLGAGVSVLVLVAIWIREVAFVDVDRLRAVLSRFF